MIHSDRSWSRAAIAAVAMTIGSWVACSEGEIITTSGAVSTNIQDYGTYWGSNPISLAVSTDSLQLIVQNTGTGIKAITLASTSPTGNLTQGFGGVKFTVPIAINQTVGPLLTYSGFEFESTMSGGQYLGFRYTAGAFNYYGWLAVQYDGYPFNVTFSQAAMNTTPGETILTGQMGGPVPEIDPATGSSALSLVAGVLAMIEQRRRRGAAAVLAG